MILENGAPCSGYGNFPTRTTFNFTCVPTATTAVLTSVTVNQQCEYVVTFQTSLVCGPGVSSSSAGIVVNNPTSVRSSSAIVPSSSSSGAIIVNSVTSLRSSSSSSSSISSGNVVTNTAGQPSSTGGSAVSTSSSGLTSGQLTAAIVAPILGVAVCCLIIFCCFCYRNKNTAFKKHADDTHGSVDHAVSEQSEEETGGETGTEEVEMGNVDQ